MDVVSCKHCGQPATPRQLRRKLCYRCYMDRHIRNRYQMVFRPYQDRRHSTGMPEPTGAMPGTIEKLAVLARRAERGQDLFHPKDPVQAPDVPGGASVRLLCAPLRGREDSGPKDEDLQVPGFPGPGPGGFLFPGFVRGQRKRREGTPRRGSVTVRFVKVTVFALDLFELLTTDEED